MSSVVDGWLWPSRPATVAGLLGHSQPSTTLDIYTHAFDKNKKAASEILQKGLEI